MFSSLFVEVIRATESDVKFTSSDRFNFPIMELDCKSLLESRLSGTRLASGLFELFAFLSLLLLFQ